MRERKHIPAALALVFLAVSAPGQERSRVVNVSLVTDAAGVAQAVSPTHIPRGSKVYVSSIDGLPHFENNLVAAFQKKRVDLVIVADRSRADFEINGFAQSQTAGWAKVIFGTGRPESEASIQMVNLKTGVVAYAVASYKVNSLNGNKSTAEHLAKNLRQKMERDEKRLRK
jgi:DNA-binding LacI/PurR family transcriptional regulator